MKKSIEHEVLTNEERRYFGLEAILPQWEHFEIKPGYAVYFDGNIIRKVISCRRMSGVEYENFMDYIECDHEIHTCGRQVVLPRTKKGKEKKLNYTSISGIRPTGCTFGVNFAYSNQCATLRAYHTGNTIGLPIVFPKDIATLAEFRKWLESFIDTCPRDYFDKVERMKNTPHRTVKYFNGDIFRFEVDLEHYGFGIIIGQIRKMKKDGLLPEEHILRSTMGVPLLVRLYLLKTKDKNSSIDQLTTYPLSKTLIMMDNPIIWGEYDLVGSKQLEASDIHFPIQAGESINHQNPDYACICWGLGLIVQHNAKEFPVQLRNRQLMRHACRCGVGRIDLERAMAIDPTKTELDELEQIAFRYFKLSLDTTFDVFNRQHGGKTYQEYAEYANKAGRHTRKGNKPRKGETSSP